MNDIKQMVKELKEDLAKKKSVALKSINHSFDVFAEGRTCDDVDSPDCKDCIEEHSGVCPMRAFMEEAFFAGASAYQMHIKEAWVSGEAGAITKKMEELSYDINKYSADKIKSGLGCIIIGMLKGEFE